MDRERAIELEALGMPSYDLADLEAPFSKQEVWDAIKCLPSDKAPGPDGNTGRFYKVCWTIIKPDIMAAISAVWGRKFANFGLLNTAYITLIPQKMEMIVLKISGLSVWCIVLPSWSPECLLIDWPASSM
jgi:hypothetical protein